MAVIDDKVVAMSFESSKFESGVNKTISSLDKLKAALNFPTAGKGLENISAAAKRVDLSHIGNGVQSISRKLEALRLIAISVLGNLSAQAVRAGAAFVKAFTLDPLKAGFAEYSTNLNSVQTILANTQASGAGLKEVNAALDELNDYSDKTIYNFGQMARNIGTFTAAGVDLKTATASIKGIANLAALSGSNADQASTAMYQLSQAISAGSVKLMDWNSVVNAGMGGTVFQRALAMTGENMGKLKKGTVELVGPMKNVKIAGESFRNSLSAPGKDGWLTSDVLTETLKMLTGDMTDAELRAKGWNEAQIKAIQQQAKTAMLAATNVKTLSQALDVAKETAGSGWAKTWRIIFGDFEEAKKTFTALSNAINGVLIDSARARNNLLGDWKALGGRTQAIEAIKIAFKNLSLILKPIKQAFRDIFPAKTGKDLFKLTMQFKEFAKALKPSTETITNLRRTFRGLFAIFSIGVQIVTGIFTVFRKMFGAVGGGEGGFLSLTATIGDFFVALDKALKKGDGLTKFFEGLGDILAIPIKLLGKLAGAIAGLFSGFSPGGFSGEIDGVSKDLIPFEKIVDAIVEGLKNLGSALGNAASNMNFEAILAVIRTGLFGGLVLMFKQFLGKGSFLSQISSGFGGGIIDNISGAFKGLSGTMTGMQNQLRAKTLKEIAIAIALLAASLFLLSLIDPKRLNSALGAMTILFVELIAAMALLDKAVKSPGFLKLPFIAASLILLSVAIGLLTLSVLAMSRLSWEELTKGLAGIGALLVGVSTSAKFLSANAGGMIRAGLGIIAIAIALNLLALAVKQLSGLSLEELAKGLGGIGVGLAGITFAMNKMPIMPRASVLGLIAMAIALKILASAVTDLSSLNMKELAKGLGAVTIALAVMTFAMTKMPILPRTSVLGLIAVAVALRLIADAVIKMGALSIEEIAKGLGTLGGALGLLAAGLYLMSGSLAGAAALSVAAAGIALLAPALVMLGKQKWSNIIKGMVALAAALTIMGIAGAAMSSVVIPLIGLGAALLLIGGGLALAGAGVFLFAAGLSALAIAGPTAIAIMIAAIIEFTEATGEMGKNLVLGLLEIVEAFAVAAPKFVDAIVKIIESLVDAIIKSTPKVAEAMTVLILAALKVLAENQVAIIAAGFSFILAFIQGIKDNIEKIATVVVDVIVKFLTAIANNLTKIVAAGVNILLSLLKGIANNLAKVVTAALSIISKFIAAIIQGVLKLPAEGLRMLTSLLKGIANNLGRAIKAGTDVIIAVVKGIGDASNRIVTQAGKSAGTFVKALATAIVKLVDDVATAIITLMNGVATVIETRSPEFYAAAGRIGKAIVLGMANAIRAGVGQIKDALLSLIPGPLKKFAGVLGLHSPSKVFYGFGENIVQGLVLGISANSKDVENSMTAMSYSLISNVERIFQTASPSKVMMQIGQFVGQGFAQGIRGSQEDIRGAFAELNSKLTEAMTTARETIASEQDKLDKLRAAKKPDVAAIKAAQATIRENQAILAKSTAAHKILVTTLKDEEKQLLALAGRFETVTAQLQAAKDKLVEVTRQRDEITDQYSTLPDIVEKDEEGNPVDAVDLYKTSLEHQIDAVSAYNATLEQLRKLGINKNLYEKLVTEGTIHQQFASQLLAGGKTAVDGLNKLDTQLTTTSKRLATNAAENLYKGGVSGAQGIVKGLQSQHDSIRREMETIARIMLSALRKELNSKSPSEEFADIGRDAMKGLANGFKDSSQIVSKAVKQAGTDALNTMKQTMRGLANAVSQELDTSPVITPILDLTLIRSQAGELSSLTAPIPITAAASYASASRISTDQNTTQEEIAGVAAGTSVKFEQNNYSPEALSDIEIYRQTKNQLSQLKSVLALT